MKDDPYQLLRAASLSGKDELDDTVMAARAEAAGQPDVLARLQEEHAQDLAISAALQEVLPPPGLEASLLTAMRAARSSVDPPASLQQNVIKAMQDANRPPAAAPGRRINRRAWLGWGTAAAAAGITAGITWWYRNDAFSMVRLRHELADISNRGVNLSLMSMDRVAVQKWLIDNQAPRPAVLPGPLDALTRKGCHLYHIAGFPVSLECFLLPGPDMRELHLFCTPTQNLHGAPNEQERPTIRKIDGINMASWSAKGQTMLLFGKESHATISGLLGDMLA